MHYMCGALGKVITFWKKFRALAELFIGQCLIHNSYTLRKFQRYRKASLRELVPLEIPARINREFGRGIYTLLLKKVTFNLSFCPGAPGSLTLIYGLDMKMTRGHSPCPRVTRKN